MMDKLQLILDFATGALVLLPLGLRIAGLADEPWAARLMKGGADLLGALKHKSAKDGAQ